MGKTSSLKTILEQIKLLQKDKKIRLVITMAAVLLSAFIQAWAIQVFVRPAEIISGGFSGAAMLIERVGSLKGLTIPMQVVGSVSGLQWCHCFRSYLEVYFCRYFHFSLFLQMRS